MLNNRQEVIVAFKTFKTGISPYIDGFQIKEEKKLDKIKDDFKKFIEYIENESKGINYGLFKDYFNFLIPSALAKKIIWKKK